MIKLTVESPKLIQWLSRFSLRGKGTLAAILICLSLSSSVAFNLYFQWRCLAEAQHALTGNRLLQRIHALFLDIAKYAVSAQHSHDLTAQVKMDLHDLRSASEVPSAVQIPWNHSVNEISLLWSSLGAREIPMQSLEDSPLIELTQAIRSLMLTVASQSHLLQARDNPTLYLVYVNAILLPQLTTLIIETSLLGAQSTAAAADFKQIHKALTHRLILLRHQLAQSQIVLANIYNAQLDQGRSKLDTLDRDINQFTIDLADYINQMNNLVDTNDPTALQKRSLVLGAEILNATSNFWTLTHARLNQNLTGSVSTLHLREILTVGIPSLLFLIAIFLLVTMAIQVVTPLRETISKVRKFRSGDLSARNVLYYDDEIGELAFTLNELGEQFQQLFSQLKQKSRLIAVSTSTLAAASRQREGAAVQQDATAKKIERTADSINATVRDLATMMHSMNERGERSAQLAGSGREMMIQMEDMLKGMADAASGAIATLKILREKASQISSIGASMDKVARGTDLVSLNAAIEAARVGQNGSGLLVLSREVRRLANTAETSSTSIEITIREMMSAVSTTVLSVECFSEQIAANSTRMQSTGKHLQNIIEHMQKQAEDFQKISRHMDNQSIKAATINQAIQEWSQSTSQAVESIQHLRSEIEQLTVMTNEMDQAVNSVAYRLYTQT